MSTSADENLNRLGITLPDAPAPAANYVPYVVAGNMVYVSGQLPLVDGKLSATGHVGKNVTTEEAAGQARLCAINLLAQLKAACGGDLSRVKQVVKLGGFVACTDDFTDQPEVVNGASDLMVEVFGDAGRHARFAVGTNTLPRGTCVEVEGTFLID
ncbi:putative translation initiation inhibitor, yjgF family [SAR116 cluster alpha proteobacterium HIMB100]|nr:putative translation initiation inhibitor, yjgF family [SAR116 cluster alpha proteobacterium HIMB100]